MAPNRRRTLSRRRASVFPMAKPNFRKALEQMRLNIPRITSSLNVSSDPTFVGYFQYYLNCPFYLIMDSETDFCLRIKPKTWALAILKAYEGDMRGIVVTLSEAIFSEEDLVFRELEFVESTMFNTEEHRQLYDRKKRVITRAAYWLWTNVGLGVNILGRIPMNENEPLNISPELLEEIENGFTNYSVVSDEENDEGVSVPLMSVGVTDLERRSRIYQHPLKNDELIKRLSDNLQMLLKEGVSEEFSMKDMFETFMGFFISSQVIALQQILNISTSEFEDAVDILQFLTHALFATDQQYSDTFFGSVQVGNEELTILERRRSDGLPELTRSLFRMVYRRYNDNTDPQKLDSSFINLKTDKSAAVLLVGVMGAAKSINLLPQEIRLTEWNRTENFEESVLTYPSKIEFGEILQNLRAAWGDARLAEPEQKDVVAANGHDQHVILNIVPVNNEFHLVSCATDENTGEKYVTFQDPDKQHIKFYVYRLQKTRKIMKESLTSLANSNGNGSAQSPQTSPEDSRKTSPEYQGGKYLLRNTFEKQTVLKMNRSTKDTPEGIALTRMLMCLKFELESAPEDIESQFITQAQNMQTNDPFYVPCVNNLHGELKVWLFSEYPAQLKKLKKYPVDHDGAE